MPTVTIRNLSEEAYRALKVRAAYHGRSPEAEMRHILEKTALPADRLCIGSALATLSREARLTNADFEPLRQACNKTSATPITFE